MAQRRYNTDHRRRRKAAMESLVPGKSLCCRCRYLVMEGDWVQVDHYDDGQATLAWPTAARAGCARSAVTRARAESSARCARASR
jgi:hypothetical protein